MDVDIAERAGKQRDMVSIRSDDRDIAVEMVIYLAS